MRNIYQNKNVVVTGHTGFKGSWLVAWLEQLGAKVTGISLDPPSSPNHFDTIKSSLSLNDCRTDIRDGEALKNIIIDAKPDFLFHLAAQPIVSVSYEEPIETWATNLMGTINVLDALKYLSNSCNAVIITSDKCYDNVEWVWGYRENDKLGGPDPYSASKGGAEIAIRSYCLSFFNLAESKIRIASARAGNVIGGGDWAKNRIVPDAFNCWAAGKSVVLRNPNATRPWQHVLEPLGGYLTLGEALSADSSLHGEAFNFGPFAENNYSVLELIKQMAVSWPQVSWEVQEPDVKQFYESALLKLNCDKAKHILDWTAKLNFETTTEMTAKWYRTYYENPGSIIDTTMEQIAQYSKQMRVPN